jgi:hypothetical protein
MKDRSSGRLVICPYIHSLGKLCVFAMPGSLGEHAQLHRADFHVPDQIRKHSR